MAFTVAVDGPAAAGKGTISRAAAAEFGFHHLDTGLLYRAVGAIGGDMIATAQNLQPKDLQRPDLRSNEAGQAASRAAAIPEVRSALIAFQRQFALREPGAILDGRDIGTVICPDAQVKLYITANDETRARRRAAEIGADFDETLRALRERDARDRDRATAPLKPAEDAILLDTSDLSVDDAIARAIAIIRGALAAQHTA